MMKKLIMIILAAELCLMYLPEKYIFAQDEPQSAEVTNGETADAASEDATIPSIPEMSGIEDQVTPIETTTDPKTDSVPEETPMEEPAPIEEVSQPAEPVETGNQTLESRNDLPTEEKWFIFDASTNTITGYSSSTSAPKNINIPSTIGGIPVYNIGNNAFAGQQLTGLTIANGIKTIGNKAFQNNPGITGELVIPDSITSIGSSAFSGCKFTSINIPNKNEGAISGAPWGATSTIYWKDVKRAGDYVFNTTTNTIYQYTGNTATLDIPSTLMVDGQSYVVKIIGDSAFRGRSTLIQVTIPDSVTSIGDEAFASCYYLTSLKIGNKVTSIGEGVFYKCYALQRVIIPDSVTSIGTYTFFQCRALESVVIGNGVTNIEDYTFSSCDYLTEVTIGSGVTSIGNRAFDGCSVLIRINIPSKNEGTISGAPWGADDAIVYWKDVKQTGDYLFNTASGTIIKYTGNETTLDIPSTLMVEGQSYAVKKIGDHAFHGNTTLTQVTIPNSVTSIGDSAFYWCRLESIVIPDSVTSLGDSAFYWCSSLTSVKIGNQVTSIGNYAFYSCSGLTNVKIGNKVTSIGDFAFRDCSKLESIVIPDSVTSIGSSAFNGCSSLTGVTIGNKVTSIGDYAFDGCSKLESIVIPDSVTGIGSSSFGGCYALTRIDIPSKNEGEISGAPWGAPSSTIVYWKDVKQVGDYVFNATTNTITKYIGTNIIVNIPSTLMVDGQSYAVKKIGINAFGGNTTLTQVTIPNSVTSIGSSAFNGCSSLTGVTIGNKVTGIGSYAFASCSKLESIVIPDSVTGIGSSAFNGCSSLTGVKIGNKVTGIGSSAFASCSKLKSIVIPDSVTSIEGYAFDSCSSLTRIDIPGKNFGSISGAPWSAPSSTMVYWKDTRVIDGYVFQYISGTITQYTGSATVLNIPDFFTIDDTDYPVKKIDKNVFKNNTTLTQVTIPNSVTSIGYDAFNGCSSLTGVTIGNKVTGIGASAFDGCSKLESIVIPDSVTSIGNGAFRNCTGLTQAVISKNISTMGDWNHIIFDNTPALQTIYMRGSRTGLPTEIVNAQPWGTSNSTVVWYAGDVVTFDHTVKKTEEPYKRIIDIRAFLNKPALINRMVLPNGDIKYVGKSEWPNENTYYHYGSIPSEAITSNGTYTFQGYDSNGSAPQSYTVTIDDIGLISMKANEASITEQMAPDVNEQDVLDLLNVSAEDEAGALTNGVDCTMWISPEDMNKIHALHLGDVVTIRVNVKSSRSGAEMTSYRDVTLNTTSCTIHASNVGLWSSQIESLTKKQLLDMMNVSVTDSTGSADMTKLVMSDEDFNRIKTGKVGTYNVLLTYDTNKAKKRVRVAIMDESPDVMIKIPSEIKMNTIQNDPTYGAGADETISIQPMIDTDLYPLPFTITTDPDLWLKSTDPNAEAINQMKVVVLNANDQLLTPGNNLLATLSGTTIQSAPFKLRGYRNEWNDVGTYSGIMNFYISYGGSG